MIAESALYHGSDALRHVVELAERADPHERDRLAQELASFWQSIWSSRSPRYDRGAERIDARAIVREAARHGGSIPRVIYRKRVRPRRLLVLADCSESSAMRPATAAIVSALSRVDPSIAVLGFDHELFSIPPMPVAGIVRLLEQRTGEALRRSRPAMSLCALRELLAKASPHAASPSQTSLLLLSDLFVAEGDDPSRMDPGALRASLRAFRAVWLVDSWPATEPFEEDEEGQCYCMASSLLEHLEQRGPARSSIEWRQAETLRTWRLGVGDLERQLRNGDFMALRARRLTPEIRAIGFREDVVPDARERLVYLPNASAADLAQVFRETRPERQGVRV